jgi:Ca2+-binding EF-hand superfamily protein
MRQRKQSSLPVNLAEQWEERAFWILVEMIEGRCVDYYTRTLRGSQVDLRVLAQVLALHLPALTTHFETLGLSLPLLATRWFMCVFALVLPVHTALHIWDQVLVHSQLGTTSPHVARDYVVLFAAALLQCAQDEIIVPGADASVSDIVLLLDRVPRLLHDKKELLQHYKTISLRLQPGGELMTKMRQSATEYVDAETKDIKRARDLMQAARQTKFSSIELSEIHTMLFKSSATRRSDRGSISVGMEGFQNILTHMIPGIAQSPAIHRLFKALDQNNDNKLDFREMICGLSILAKGTLDEKLELLFKSFDVDSTGFITQAQLEALITSVSAQLDPECPDKHSSMGSGVVGTDPLGVRVVPVSTFVSQVFAHLCITTGKLSLDQFRQAVIAEPRLIECLMVGLDQEDIPINLTPVEEPASPPEPTAAATTTTTTATTTAMSAGSSSATTPISHPLPVWQNTAGEDMDDDLPLAVTDSDNQTPLLSDSHHHRKTPTPQAPIEKGKFFFFI